MKRHLLLLWLILSSFVFLAGAITIQQKTIWWDSAVYIGMGKYYWSFGESGLLEPSRPPLLPLILGTGWKLGIDPVIFAILIALLFSIGTLFLTYKIGERLFSREVGLLAASFIAFSGTFLFFSSHALTEIPSAFFLLAGIYAMLSSRFFLGGALFGLAILSRFFQVITVVFFLFSFFIFIEKNQWRLNLGKIAIGIGFLIAPYAIMVWWAFGDPFYPLAIQHILTTETGTIYFEPWWFYMANLLTENFLILSLLAFPLLTIKQIKKQKNFLFLALPSLVLLLLYSLQPHKEMRLILPFLPLLLLAVPHTIMESLKMIKNKLKKKITAFSLIGAWLIFSILQVVPLLPLTPDTSPQEQFFQDYLKDAKGEIWINNPKFALLSDAKIAGLPYYPVIEGVPELALINMCDFEGNSEQYTALTSSHLSIITSTLKKTYSSTENGCEYAIYQKAIS